MKTSLQKHKYLVDEIKKKQAVLVGLGPEARALADLAADEAVYTGYTEVQAKLAAFRDHCEVRETGF